MFMPPEQNEATKEDLKLFIELDDLKKYVRFLEDANDAYAQWFRDHKFLIKEKKKKGK